MRSLSYTETRNDLKKTLDTVEAREPVQVRRSGVGIALVRVPEFLDTLLASSKLPRALCVAEAGGWSVMMPGTPIAADGADLDEATDNFVEALNEYVEDWPRLKDAPNHAGNWALVQFVALATPDEIRAWITATA